MIDPSTVMHELIKIKINYLTELFCISDINVFLNSNG